ncbi:carboxylate-amine ligase [Saccharothrix syringae]|uniref:Putative glutamate--cysteine ligase 2 n=1 Tax=Saccharothrix syringae TaxID=103733 RepID=A0A5Q0H0E6_SACSY|nr:glutamate--cysteine ligase [Saccharothrix syringae]QFZ19132.1 YbdK family carboxylate-amine ligase [Saccharothrix syringae]
MGQPLSSPGHPTVGVEEEFLLVDPATGAPVPRAHEVVAAARGAFGLELDHELITTQVEAKTTVCWDLPQVRRELVAMRAAVARAAGEVGCLALAVGAPPLGEPAGPVTDVSRYRRIARAYGALAEEQSICGCHVHVAVPDREVAVQVCNHLRPWLAVLGALTANSPLARGRDTGYASWRSLVWARWPAAGPPPYFSDWAHYRAVCDVLDESGAAMDPGMVYWDVRPSSHLPTVEVRVADVQGGPTEALLLTALVRALVGTAEADVGRGVTAPPVPTEALRLAGWRAARDGLGGWTLDVLSDRLVPVRHLLRAMVRHVLPALSANGDLGFVERALAALDRVGGGAERQRRVLGRTGAPTDLLDLLAVDAPDPLVEAVVPSPGTGAADDLVPTGARADVPGHVF